MANIILKKRKPKSKLNISQIKNILMSPVKNFFLYSKKLSNSAWTVSKGLFNSFPIKQKLSIIIGLIVVAVIFVLSIIFQQTEKKLLQSKLEEICNLSVQYLSYVIQEDLLLGEYDRIKAPVLRIKNQNIKGLDYAWVINRYGVCIAHTNLRLTEREQQFISEDHKKFLLALKTPTVSEHETHYDYYYPIFEVKKSGAEQTSVFLGVTGIGFSKEVLLNPIRDAQKIIYMIALLVTLLSVLGIYFLSQRMVQQIQALSEGARQIGQGNLDIKISVNTRDELGQLAQEFNNMTMHLKEKLQMQKFVSQMTRQMIKKNLYSNEQSIKSEHCEIGVLFSDVRDFARFSQRNKPEIVVAVINIYLDLQAKIIEENFGIVDKFMGDQIMGVFEGTNKHINTLNAAVAIQKEISKLNFKRRISNLEILTVGIGINIGQAVLGNIGSQDRMDYTVVGDVVNLASRFCDIAKQGQVITSSQLYSSFKFFYPMAKLGAIKIKGRDEPVEICNIDYHRDYIM
jgi:class 3 adenylate cyclase